MKIYHAEPDVHPSTLGWRKIVLDWLDEKELTVSWLSRHIRMSKSHVGKCINAECEPSKEMLLRMEMVMWTRPGVLTCYAKDEEIRLG